MNRCCVDLVVNLDDVLTPASFSTIVVQLIKYIAYNSKSIPYSYEGLSHLVNRRRHLLNQSSEKSQMAHSYNDIVAKNYFIKVSEAYDNYETTFKSLSEEFKSPDKVKQVIFLTGNTLINPRCSYRIQKPFLSIDESENAPPVRKTLETILRTLLHSSHMNSVFESASEPSNLFILIELSEGQNPKTEWFVPFDNFSPSSTKKEIKIVLDSPSSADSSKTDLEPDSSAYKPNESDQSKYDSCSNWYRSKEALKGFKDMKIAGKPIFNYLLKS